MPPRAYVEYMNRREFTASLGALSGAAALPLSVVPAAAAASPPVSSATYAWAKLIVRAQAKADPAMLVRYLKLTPDVAHSLFSALIRDGVLRVQRTAAVARALDPLQSGLQRPSTSTIQQQTREAWAKMSVDTRPLVKEEPAALECADTVEKEAVDACTSEPVQESPHRG